MTAASFFHWAEGVLLTAARLAVLFIAVPPFAGIAVPALARIVLIVALAAGMAGSGIVSGISLTSPLELVSALLHEVMVGAALAAGLFAGFGSFQFAGRLLDFQIGYGMASLVDLATRNQMPLLGVLLSSAATVYFFCIDGHLALLRLFRLSLVKIPPGTGLMGIDPTAIVAQFAMTFSFGFVLVAPVVLCLLLVDVGMAFMSRSMPQMNVFMMSLALKVFVGLMVFAMTVPLAAGSIERVFETVFNFWEGWAD